MGVSPVRIETRSADFQSAYGEVISAKAELARPKPRSGYGN